MALHSTRRWGAVKICFGGAAVLAGLLVAACSIESSATQEAHSSAENGSRARAGLVAVSAPPPKVSQSATPVPASSPFYLGADISSIAAGGGRGGPATYQDVDGKSGSEIAVMMAHGWNAFRLRVFVSPVRSAPNNSLENTIALAKQIKAAGATFMLDIHYSDTWADPQHQEIPVAWRNLSVEQLSEKVELYTVDVLKQLKDAGAAPEMVQVGNEITGGTLWPQGHVKVPPSDVKNDAGRIQALPEPYDDEKQWANFTSFIKAGVRGVRTTLPTAKVIIHIDCGGDWPVTKWFFDHFTAAGVDYDIIGQSFYPNYHGTLALMQQNAAETFKRYGKPVMIAETGYPQTGNPQAGPNGRYMFWPGTPAGQAQFMADLVNTAQRQPHVIGVFYWQPEGRGRSQPPTSSHRRAPLRTNPRGSRSGPADDGPRVRSSRPWCRTVAAVAASRGLRARSGRRRRSRRSGTSR